MATVREIYERFGLQLTEDVAARMRLWIVNQPAWQKSGHHYTAESVGLTETGLRELYAGYIEQFDLV
jgi:hypothetical protein